MGKLLGEQLTFARVEKGVSVPELSRMTGYSLSHIHRVEEGEREPSYKVLAKLSEALGLDINEMVKKQVMDKGYSGVMQKSDGIKDPRTVKEIRETLNSYTGKLAKTDLLRLMELVEAYYPHVLDDDLGT